MKITLPGIYLQIYKTFGEKERTSAIKPFIPQFFFLPVAAAKSLQQSALNQRM